MGPFSWLAVYVDGTTLWQFQDGRERSSEEIDRSRLRTLALLTKERVPFYVQHFAPSQRMIYRRRTAMPPDGPPQVRHLIGWQQTLGGRNVQHLATVCDETGRVECVDHWNESHPWFRPIEEVAADSTAIA